MPSTPLTDAIQALTTYANTVTGASDTDLSSAVDTLAAGYGAGGYSLDDFVSGAEPSGDVTTNATTIFTYVFCNRNAVLSVTAPNAVTVGERAFGDNTGIKSIYVGGINATFASYAVDGCQNLEELHIPNAKSSFSFGGYGLRNCKKLKLIDFGYAGSINFQSLPSNSPLDTVIVRKTGTVATLTANSLNNSLAFANGGTGGEVYVPSALIDSYKVATNWSTYYGYGTMTFKAIEGSIYE